MKFLCSTCERLGEVQRFRVEQQTLVLICPTCGAESHSAPAAPAAPVAESLAAPAVDHDLFNPPPGHCPRCISKRPDGALSCASCGLTFSNATDGTFAPSPWLEAEWKGLREAWEDDRRHDQLRSAALEQGELAPLGRLYRVRLAWVPGDQRAQRGRDEVVRLAVLPQSITPPRAQPEVATWKYVLAAAIIIAALGTIVVMLRVMLDNPV